MEVTDKQLKMMRHALGLDYKKKPYRNYFFTSEFDSEWNDLVNKELATKGQRKFSENEDHVYFWLTKSGAELAYGKKISKKFYKEL